MNTNPGITRNYHISDGDLALFANALTLAMTRDLTEQSVYGVTETSLDDFNDLINEFQAMPNDEVLKNDLSYSVELRELSRNTILNTMRSISARAKAVFGTNTSKYRSMSPGQLSLMTDSLLLIAASKVHDAALNNIAALAGEGVTTVYLTTFNSAIESFESAIKSVDDKKLLRDDGIEAKVLKGNELYSLIVKYCDYGKLLWTNVSPAKYNDYVIYESSGGSSSNLAAPTNLTIDVATMVFSWASVENADEYILETSVVGVEWEVIYSGPENFVMYVPETEGLNVYRVKGSNSIGSGMYSSMMSFNYHGLSAPDYISASITNASTGEVALNWGEVPLSTFYKLYVSSVALGAEAGEYVLVGQYDIASHTGTFALSQRHFFKVITGNIDEESIASDSVYVEL